MTMRTDVPILLYLVADKCEIYRVLTFTIRVQWFLIIIPEHTETSVDALLLHKRFGDEQQPLVWRQTGARGWNTGDLFVRVSVFFRHNIRDVIRRILLLLFLSFRLYYNISYIYSDRGRAHVQCRFWQMNVKPADAKRGVIWCSLTRARQQGQNIIISSQHYNVCEWNIFSLNDF